VKTAAAGNVVTVITGNGMRTVRVTACGNAAGTNAGNEDFKNGEEQNGERRSRRERRNRHRSQDQNGAGSAGKPRPGRQLESPAGKHDTAVLFSCRRKNCMWRLQRRYPRRPLPTVQNRLTQKLRAVHDAETAPVALQNCETVHTEPVHVNFCAHEPVHTEHVHAELQFTEPVHAELLHPAAPVVAPQLDQPAARTLRHRPRPLVIRITSL
jgi:hypothetical protein